MIITGLAAAISYFSVAPNLLGDGTSQAIIDLEEAPFALDFRRNYPSKVFFNSLFVRVDGQVDASYTASASISHGVVTITFNKPLPVGPFPDNSTGGFATFYLNLAYDSK
jgi:hypothetical protein